MGIAEIFVIVLGLALFEIVSSIDNAVSFGASVFRKDWLENKDFKSIGQAVKRFVTAAEQIARI